MAVASLLCKIFQPSAVIRNSFLHGLFNPSPLWLLVRLIGGVAVVMTFFQVGPEAIWEENTGGLVLTGLLPTLFAVFIFAIALGTTIAVVDYGLEKLLREVIL